MTPLYSCALSPYIYVLITSTGVLHITDAAPATPPEISKQTGSGRNVNVF